MDAALADQLLAMARKDLAVRRRLAEDGSLFDGYHPAMQAVHEENAAALETILTGHGWPTADLVGDDGAEAAWLIVQHAIGRPSLQRRCLGLLQEAASAGRVPAWQPAMLEDRIRVFEGRSQIYGTSFDWDEGGQMSPLPIEDAERVDERRAKVGLEPLSKAIAQHRAGSAGETRPKDLAERQRQAEAWARQVGWR